MTQTKRIIFTRCPMCTDEEAITVDEADYDKWKGGMLIQKAMPYLNKDKRERLITGICNKCWRFLDND